MKHVIPLKLISVEGEGAHILVTSRLNKNVNGYCIVDTGASVSAFDKELFENEVILRNLNQKIQSSGITNHSLNALPVSIEKIFIGKIKFNINQAVLIDLSHINKIYKQFTNKKIIGIIGGNFLTAHKALINYGKLTLTIYKKLK